MILLKLFKQQLFYFIKRQCAIAAMEFTLIIPVFIALLFGALEITQFLQMNQKLDNTVHTLSDLINQNLTLTSENLQKYIDTAPAMLKPYDSNGYRIIITSIEFPELETHPTTLWQYRSGEIDGNAPSKVSSGKGAQPTIPAITLEKRDQVLTVEMYLNYKSVFNNDLVKSLLNLSDHGVYKVIIARPRFGSFEFDPTLI